MTTPILQFGTSRFLQAHVDLFISEALDAGHALTGLMLAGVDNYAVPEFRAMLKMHVPPVPEDAGADVLASELRSRLDERLCALSQQPPEFFSRIITRWDGQQLTNLEMLETIKDHELTHRSQLFQYLRFNGIVPVTTRRRESKK